MKNLLKSVKLLLLVFVLVIVSCICVNAEDTSLIPVSSAKGSGNTFNESFDHYSYSNAQLYRQNGELYFYSDIMNNAKKKQYISVEVLLFDKDGKNIGIFNYCSNKDYETEFSGKELTTENAISFNYKLTSKYLADPESNKLDDVVSFAIISDNEYCKVGGYDKYKGKDINAIVKMNTEVTSGTRFDNMMNTINKYIPINGLNLNFSTGMIIIIVIIIISLALWIIYGSFLNKLHDKMYRKTTPLAYVPIANGYICVKMAFGSIIGYAYLGITIFGALLTLINLGFISAIANLILIVAFIIDIIKLITGNYDMCYLDGQKNNVLVNNFNKVKNTNDNKKNNNDTESVDNLINRMNSEQEDKNKTNEYGYNQKDNVVESLMGMSNKQSLDDDNTTEDVNVGGNNNQNNNNNNNDDNSRDSDLSRFFR